MSDAMTRLTKASMDLKKFTNAFNYWTFLVIIIYLVLLFGGIFFPTPFQEPFLAIISGITLFFIIIAYLAVFFVKDTQKAIILTLIRAIISAVLPFALVFGTLGPLSLYLKTLGIVLFLIGLIFFYFLLRPLLTMNAVTKELMKGQKSG
jgi:carbon starvation protein CstA